MGIVRDELVGELVPIPPGTVALRDEGSGRTWQVSVPGFLLAEVPVTRLVWQALRGSDEAVNGPGLPKTEVSWYEAVAFCNDASTSEGLQPCYARDSGGRIVLDADANGYRLPTEAEWEHACRAGSSDVRYGVLDAIAWYADNSGGEPHVVGGKRPNDWGLFDMIGNVWEWCWDLFDPATYGEYRVFRGGGFADPPRGCRASCRRKSHPTLRIDDLGFRLARNGGGEVRC